MILENKLRDNKIKTQINWLIGVRIPNKVNMDAKVPSNNTFNVYK